MNKTTKAITASVLGLTLGLGVAACGSDDDDNTTISSRGDQQIDLPKEYDLSKRKGNDDFSPFSVALNAEKVADVPGLSATRGLQVVDGKLIGHTLVNKSNGASKVFSVDFDGSNYETVKEFGPVSESLDAKYASPPPEDRVIFPDDKYRSKFAQFNPESFGLAVVQENSQTKPGIYALRGGALPLEDGSTANRVRGEVVTLGDSQLLKDAQRGYDETIKKKENADKDSTDSGYSYQLTEFANICVDNSKLDKDNLKAPTLSAKDGVLMAGAIGGRSSRKDPMELNSWIDENYLTVNKGSTSRYKDKMWLSRTTACTFSDNYLVTNIRKHVPLNGKGPEKLFRNGAKSAKIALSLPDHDKDYGHDVTHLVSINDLPNDDADVTTVAVDPNDPDNLYFTIEGDEGLYKLDLSPIKGDFETAGFFFDHMLLTLPDDLNEDSK